MRIRRISPKRFGTAIAVLASRSRIIPWLEAKAGFARIERCYATDSKLLWDEAAQRDDAEITPTYGSQTLQGFSPAACAKALSDRDSWIRRCSDEEQTGVWSGSF